MKYRFKTSKQLTIILAAAVLGFTGATAIAEGKGNRMFEQADADGDGYISFEEFQPPKQRARRADLDGDGQITRAEMTEHANTKGDEILERANEHFTRMDANGDDVVTQEEARQAVFNRLDRDQDGYLSKKEMKRAKKRRDNRKG